MPTFSSIMDGDGADDPAAIAALIAPIEEGACDFVIASRARGKREPGSMSWHQLLAGRVIGALVGLFYGARYTDMCALRAIRRDTLFALGMREMTYGWNLEMQMRAARAHLRVREVPVDYRCRIGGQSKVAGSLSGSLKAGAEFSRPSPASRWSRSRRHSERRNARPGMTAHHLVAAPLRGNAQLVRICLSGSSQNAHTAEPTTSNAAATMNGACQLPI